MNKSMSLQNHEESPINVNRALHRDHLQMVENLFENLFG